MRESTVYGTDYKWEPEPREPWVDGAACATTDPEIFFPEQGGAAAVAKRVCAGCDVIEECLAYALRVKPAYGVWGGKSPRERVAMQSPRSRLSLLDLPESTLAKVRELHDLGWSAKRIGEAVELKDSQITYLRSALKLSRRSMSEAVRAGKAHSKAQAS